MSKRIQLVPAAGRQNQPSLAISAVDCEAASSLEILAQLVEQIDDALLVVEHPHLAARVYAALRSTKAA